MWFLKWLIVVACLFVTFVDVALSDALDSWSTWSGAQPYVSKQVPPSALVMRGIGTDAYYVLEVDETTGEIPVSLSGASITIDYSGATGSPVPADAAFVGGTDGTNLRGIKVDTSGELQVDVLSSALPSGAATSAKQPALGTAGTASTDVITVQGIAAMTPIIVSSTNLDIRDLTSVSDSVAAVQSGTWTVDVSGSSTVSVENLPTTVDTNAGANSASTLRVTEGSRSYADSATLAYSSTNVTTADWVEVDASTAAAFNYVCITDQSGQILELGTGAAAAETRVFLIARGFSGCIPLRIAASTRLSLKAVSATANTGDFVISGMN